MVITEIKQAVKTKNRGHIYLNGEYRFTLSFDDIIKLGLSQGKEISSELLAEIEETVLYKGALREAFKMLSRSDCPCKKIMEKLTLKDYPDAVIEKVITELTEKGYVNDYEYAKRYIENALSTKKKGKAYIELELYKKGINREVISTLLEECYHSDGIIPVAKARFALLNKKELPPEKAMIKLKEYLFRQGFSYDEIRFAVNQVAGKDKEE